MIAFYQLIEPYGAGLEPKQNEDMEQKLLEKVEMSVGPTSGPCCMSSDSESKEIKNIYIDCKLLIFVFPKSSI